MWQLIALETRTSRIDHVATAIEFGWGESELDSTAAETSP
jgi:hypothetical protein